MHGATFDGHPGSGLYAGAHELLGLARELQHPTLVAPETWRSMITPQYPDLNGVLPGLRPPVPQPVGPRPGDAGTKSPHWSAPWSSPETFGHFGRSGTLLWVDPVADVAMVALTDREFGAWAIDAWPRLTWETVLDHA